MNIKFRLCLAIPYAGGPVVEAGVEKFLRDRREILGNSVSPWRTSLFY